MVYYDWSDWLSIKLPAKGQLVVSLFWVLSSSVKVRFTHSSVIYGSDNRFLEPNSNDQDIQTHSCKTQTV